MHFFFKLQYTYRGRSDFGVGYPFSPSLSHMRIKQYTSYFTGAVIELELQQDAENLPREGGRNARLNIGVLPGSRLSRPVTVRVLTANIDATGWYSASSLVFQFCDIWRCWMYQLLCMFGSHYPLIACGQVQGKFFKVIGLENGKGHYLRIIHLTPSLKLDSHACMLAFYMPAQPGL